MKRTNDNIHEVVAHIMQIRRERRELPVWPTSMEAWAIYQKNIGIRARPAPAGAGTPVRNPADLCGWWLSSILALKRARRSAQNTAKISEQIQPTRGKAVNDQR